MNSSDQPEWGVFMGGVNGLLMLSKGIHLKNRPTKASFDIAGWDATLLTNVMEYVF